MELQLVTFEQAKVLKELRFPQGWGCETHYCLESEGEYGYQIGNIISANAAYKKVLDVISAPALELVAKWLREEKSIEILPQPYSYNYLEERTSSYTLNMWFGDNFEEYSEAYDSYEEALSAGIDKALKTLKNK